MLQGAGMTLVRAFLGLVIVGSVAAFVYVAANGTGRDYAIGGGTGALVITGTSALLFAGIFFIGAIVLFAILGNRR